MLISLRLATLLTPVLGICASATIAFAGVAPRRLDAAEALFRAGKAAEAEAAYAAIAKEDPQNPEVAIRLSRLALQRGEPEKAVRLMEEAVEWAPNHSECHRALGDAYGRFAQTASVFRRFGLAKKCLAAYQRAVELDPQNVEARMCLFDYYRLAPGFIGGSKDKAAAQAAEIKKLDPARGGHALATLHASERNYERAFAEINEVLKTTPDDYRANYELGHLAVTTRQQLDRGLASLRRCLALAPPANQPGHAAVHWRIGHLLEQKADIAAARSAYAASLELDPNFKPAAESLRKLK